MYRDPRRATRRVLIGALVGAIASSVGNGGCGGEDERGAPGIRIDFSRRELLADASAVAIYFYEQSTACADIRASLPRPTSILGPFTTLLDEEGRSRGITFTLDRVPQGEYVVYVDALDINGALVGTGCAPAQIVRDRRVSQILVTVS